ncbi:MAG: D-alanine--D-alanine ligase [Candidatus Adiutrix intracellularis]|jgi:D-alanine-D-alanine ligase|nr:D-alanine--D-alanine ligase [Candidatus Adiutrix intracellularis]
MISDMAGAKKRVALLMGGKSGEREVSLNSGAEVQANIDQNRFEVTVYDPAFDLVRLADDGSVGRFDVAFLALHGPFGEDGSIQGFLEMLGRPYTGSGILASALAIDKEATKKAYRKAGLPVAPDLVLSRDEVSEQFNTAKIVFYTLGSPVVVKPLRQGSSLGLTLAGTEIELKRALAAVFDLGERAMVEKYLPGREFTCAVVGTKNLLALPIIEIIPAEGHTFFNFSAKYEAGQSQEICPADASLELTGEIQRLSVNAHRALGCQGLSRSDLILSDGQSYLLETNTLPGLTSGSLVPKMIRAYGLTFTAFISYLIDQALSPEAEVSLDDYRG